MTIASIKATPALHVNLDHVKQVLKQHHDYQSRHRNQQDCPRVSTLWSRLTAPRYCAADTEQVPAPELLNVASRRCMHDLPSRKRQTPFWRKQTLIHHDDLLDRCRLLKILRCILLL